MDIQFTGKIIAALPLQQGTSKRDGQPWFKAEYVIEELNQRYPSRCCFQVFGSDKIQQLNIQQGEVVTVHLGINANQSQDGSGRWFNQLDCWKVDRFGAKQPQQAYTPPIGQTYQSQIGATVPQPAPIQQQIQQFPPQVDATGQPVGQQPQPSGGQPTNSGLPFPGMNQ